MKFRYNELKNKELIMRHGLGFDELIDEIINGNLLNSVAHHNQIRYPNQRIMHIVCIGKVYCMPYIREEENVFFLKTLYPSQKATKKYLKNIL